MGRKANRDFYFVGIGGWDMHTQVEAGLFRRFGDVNQGIGAFVTEMKAQGLWKQVVVASMSDFGRTLDPNANLGTDHAWAGNHFVLSGALRGEQVFSRCPARLRAGNFADVGRGRLIPGYPYESYMAPIAKWVGVEASQLGTVFPNLGNFNSSHIGSDMFE